MKSIIAATSSAILALASTTQAQTYQQSKPFYLVLEQPNGGKYNGLSLFACHEGAAIEGLCLGGEPGSSGSDQFQFNTTEGAAPPSNDESLGVQGLLTFELRGGNFNTSEPMHLSYDPTSNVALPLFYPSELATPVAFDDQQRMNIQSSIDDTVTPPDTTTDKAFYNWFICESYGGYLYTTLNWVVGHYPVPQNPSCVSVTVKRQFV